MFRTRQAATGSGPAEQRERSACTGLKTKHFPGASVGCAQEAEPASKVNL